MIHGFQFFPFPYLSCQKIKRKSATKNQIKTFDEFKRLITGPIAKNNNKRSILKENELKKWENHFDVEIQ